LVIGVTVWELITFGQRPYEFENIAAKDLYKQLKVGFRLQQPQYCTLEVYDIMIRTWVEPVRQSLYTLPVRSWIYSKQNSYPLYSRIIVPRFRSWFKNLQNFLKIRLDIWSSLEID